MTRACITGLIASLLFVHAQAQSQSAPAPSAPSAPHELLAFFEGSWTTSETTVENQFRETCAWLPEGRRHMVCRSRWQTTNGAREGWSIFSYHPASGEYQYHGLRASGTVVTQRGKPVNGGWIFSSESGDGATRVRNRAVIVPNGDRGFDFTSETAKGDDPWKAAGPKVTYTRVQ